MVRGYIANIIRVKNSEKTYTTEALQKKLLQGDTFALVESINADGLKQLCDLASNRETGLEYKPEFVVTADEVRVSERELLLERRRKSETALNRLRQIFLFQDSGIPETEYIVERQKLTDDLQRIDDRLSKLNAEEENGPITDESFIKKASYFIMVEKLLDKKSIDYEKYIRSIDLSIPRNFIQSVVERIETYNGNVSAIVFKNGMRHEFSYRNQ